jgi:hypothetical protein
MGGRRGILESATKDRALMFLHENALGIAKVLLPPNVPPKPVMFENVYRELLLKHFVHEIVKPERSEGINSRIAGSMQ